MPGKAGDSKGPADCACHTIHYLIRSFSQRRCIHATPPATSSSLVPYRFRKPNN